MIHVKPYGNSLRSLPLASPAAMVAQFVHAVAYAEVVVVDEPVAEVILLDKLEQGWRIPRMSDFDRAPAEKEERQGCRRAGEKPDHARTTV